MPKSRRYYLYTVALISLVVVLWGLVGLLRALIGGEGLSLQANALAGSLALFSVGLPVLGLHAWLLRRSLQKDPDERFTPARPVFLYTALLVVLIPAVLNFIALINRPLLVLFGASPQRAILGGNQAWIDHLIALIVTLLAAVALYSFVRRDRRLEAPRNSAVSIQRLYRYTWFLFGLGLLVFGAQQILQYLLLGTQAPGTHAEFLLADGLALVLAGAPIWWLSEARIQESLAQPEEQGAWVRRVALSIISFASLAGTLIAAGLLMEALLQSLLRLEFQPRAFLLQAGLPLSIGIPMLAVWVYYGQRLRTVQLARPPTAETPESEKRQERSRRREAILRRLYQYGLAFLGLAAAVFGIQRWLAIGLDWLFDPLVSWGPLVQDRLAEALAVSAIGLPVWVYAWAPVQREAARSDSVGTHERRSNIRKGYLYLVVFLGVAGVTFGAGFLIFELARTLLQAGMSFPLLNGLQFLRLLAVFGLFLTYHLYVLRTDGRMDERSLARRYAKFPVLVLSTLTLEEIAAGNGNGSHQEAFAYVIANTLHKQFPDMPVAIHPYRQGVPDETLSAAQTVIVPSELLAQPSEAWRLWLQSFPGTRLVIPTPAQAWHWIAADSQSLHSMANQAAAAVRRMAEGREPDAPPELSPWVVASFVFTTLLVALGLLGISGFDFYHFFSLL